MRVAISTGHGFSNTKKSGYAIDPGAVNKGVGITEATAVGRCGSLLMEILRDSPIDAVEIPHCSLQERIQIINVLHKKNPFNLAIEIHLNSFYKKSVRGTEVWFCKNSVKGQSAALIMRAAIGEILESKNRGVRSKNLAFLNDTLPPAIITEAEFISSPIVADELKTGILIQKIAWAHALGIWRIQKEWF